MGHQQSSVGRWMAVFVAILVLVLSATSVSAAPLAGATQPPDGSVVIHDAVLSLETNGAPVPHPFTGINAYDLTSNWAINAGCGYGGWTTAQIHRFFASLPPNALVRTWAFQSMATSIVGGIRHRDWRALDQVISQASLFHIHLILTLANQDGTCDDGQWKDLSWYSGGWRDQNAEVTSYATWVHDVVTRYADQPVIAMWEPVNEPQAVDCTVGDAAGGTCFEHRYCPSEADGRAALRSFFDGVGAMIHQLDPGSLVSDGSLGGGNCGNATTPDYSYVIASPGIDVVGYHDYSGYGTPSDLALRAREAADQGKPTMIGEAGVTGCANATQRSAIFAHKMADAFRLGVSAYLLWWYDNDQGDPTCSSPIFNDAPTWHLLSAGGWPTPRSPATN